jgi:hypothetical protein
MRHSRVRIPSPHNFIDFLINFKFNVAGLHYIPPETSSMRSWLEINLLRDASGDFSGYLQGFEIVNLYNRH